MGYIKPLFLPGFLSHKPFYPEFTLFIRAATRAVRHPGIMTPHGARTVGAKTALLSLPAEH